MKEINEELSIIISEKDILAASTLNVDLKYVFDSVLEKVLTGEAVAFFVDGPGGTS